LAQESACYAQNFAFECNQRSLALRGVKVLINKSRFDPIVAIERVGEMPKWKRPQKK
jgi:hypothetical protein